MDITIIIGFVLLVVVVVLVFKLIKKFIAAFFIANLIIFLTVVGVGFLVYNDVMDMQEKMPTAQKLFFLEDNNSLLTGLSMVSFESEEDFEILDSETLSEKGGYYKDGELDKVLGDAYKMVVVKLAGLEGVGAVGFDSNKIPEETVFQMLRSDNPLEVMIENMTAGREFNEIEDTDGFKEILRRDFTEQFGEGAGEVKGALAGMLIISAIGNKGPFFVIEEYKEGNVIIYPETITFKLVKSIPLVLFHKVTEKMMGEEDLSSAKE